MAICEQEKSDLLPRATQCHESLRRRLLHLHSPSVKHVHLVAVAQLCKITKGISRQPNAWFGAVANNALKLFVCSYRRLFSQLQSKLFEPGCFVPIPALKINLAVHNYHLAEPDGGFLSRPTPSSTKPIASTIAPT
jgi:hypothetical protein